MKSGIKVKVHNVKVYSKWMEAVKVVLFFKFPILLSVYVHWFICCLFFKEIIPNICVFIFHFYNVEFLFNILHIVFIYFYKNKNIYY